MSWIEEPNDGYDTVMLNDRYCMEDYLHGYCEYFAYALHQELGYPMYKVYDSEAETDMALVHVFCINPNGEYVDVRGVIPNIWDLIEPYEDFLSLESAVIAPYMPSDWLTEPDTAGQDIIVSAKEYICGHRNLYAAEEYIEEDER